MPYRDDKKETVRCSSTDKIAVDEFKPGLAKRRKWRVRIEAIGGIQRIVWMIRVGWVERIGWIVSVHWIQWIAGVKLIGGIKGTIRIKPIRRFSGFSGWNRFAGLKTLKSVSYRSLKPGSPRTGEDRSTRTIKTHIPI